MASLLAEVQNSFKAVHIGSYPSTTETKYILLYDVMMCVMSLFDSKYEVKISLESQCMDQLIKVWVKVVIVPYHIYFSRVLIS